MGYYSLIYKYFSSVYIFLVFFLSIIFAFINYFYQELYKSKIDVFIFSLKNDNTSAILSIIFNDYPVIYALIIAILFASFCIYLNIKILSIKLRLKKINIYIVIVLNLFLLFVYFTALRGHYKYNALRASTYTFSLNNTINEISTNPLMAFSWAFKEYKNSNKIYKIDYEKGKKLQEKLFSIYSITSNYKKEQPHIMLNIMESFGMNVLAFSDKNNDFLGSLKQHFKDDFLFSRILSRSNSTIFSFGNLIFLNPNSNLYQGIYKKKILSYTPIKIYKDAGYKVVFAYSGNASWYDLGNYLKNQGVDLIIDENTILKKYPNSKNTKHKYGIKDEYLYKEIFDLLLNSKEKIFLISLTISNHRPYVHKSDKNLIDFKNIDNKLFEKIHIQNCRRKNKNTL